MKRTQPTLDELFATQLRVLATTLRPKTMKGYRMSTNNFLTYLHTAFPRVIRPSQLRRDPHLLGWFRFLCQPIPYCRAPKAGPTPRKRIREVHLQIIRRLLHDLADQGHPITPDLIRPQDFPLHDHYLPKPLSLDEDQRLQQQLRLTDSLEANALLLMRATGIRIGECIGLPLDCLRRFNEQQVALHVPLGKLHSERLVPVDDETQRIVARMLELRALTPTPKRESQQFLLPSYRKPETWYAVLYRTLGEIAHAAGCTSRVHPHRLRHSFATEMVRLGLSLPALMQIMGHKDIHMTLRYVKVVQLDLQREFHHARQNAASLYSIPQLPLPSETAPTRADLVAIRQSISATHHLLQLFQPQLEPKARRKLHRLIQRLLNLDRELDHLTPK